MSGAPGHDVPTATCWQLFGGGQKYSKVVPRLCLAAEPLKVSSVVL